VRHLKTVLYYREQKSGRRYAYEDEFGVNGIPDSE